tara:strand:- start:1627 stop:1857 length:231 start_codon:yes stop_codon:yes gene_type:complete
MKIKKLIQFNNGSFYGGVHSHSPDQVDQVAQVDASYFGSDDEIIEELGDLSCMGGDLEKLLPVVVVTIIVGPLETQ